MSVKLISFRTSFDGMIRGRTVRQQARYPQARTLIGSSSIISVK